MDCLLAIFVLFKRFGIWIDQDHQTGDLKMIDPEVWDMLVITH